MIKKGCLLILLMLSIGSYAKADWGKTGHRTVGEIASNHLSKKASKEISKLLDGHSLAFVSIYADEIRSNHKYDSFGAWHYVNFSENKKYNEEPKNPKGDIIQGIKKCILNIKNEDLSKEDRAFYLKMLVHFVGDLHMPLHAGNKTDKGGNDIKVKWFGGRSNLHRVWDSDMIDSYKMSYTELANNIDLSSNTAINNIQKGSLLDWTYESRTLALKVYKKVNKDDSLSYEYMYHNFPIVRNQLNKGGLRLAFVLNEIFKSKSSWLDNLLKE